MLRFLFPISLFLGALLLFSIQPMVAKALLPVYGGTPAVWTVCMLFFQVILLSAYGYVALLGFMAKPMLWRVIHSFLLVFSLSAVPLLFHPFVIGGAPEWSIFHNLLTQLGLPLLVLGASAPLLQFAYSQTQEKGAADPYFLYIASNLGSLLALLLYPSMLERLAGLKFQFHLWSIGYIVYAILLFFLLFSVRYKPLKSYRDTNSVRPGKEIFYWVFLSFVPCSLMLGVTSYITTDMAATPLFWIMPLALYLLTFIIAFTEKPFISFPWLKQNCILFLVFVVLGFILTESRLKVWQSVLFNLISFFILALICHRQVFLRRPKPQFLTLFYLCLALGGVLAGIFNGILAPHWFNQVYEYPIAILLSLLILPQLKLTGGWWVPLVVLGILLIHYVVPEFVWPGNMSTFQVSAILALLVLTVWQQSKISLFLSMLILFGFIFSPALQEQKILVQERNFYGVKKVLDKDGTHALMSQSTIHGLQLVDQKKPKGFTSYYGAIQPVVKMLQQKEPSLSVTLIGLGVGTMLCQYRKEDLIKVIEIDPQVIELAKTPSLFSYLRDCPPQQEIIVNDGRLALEQWADNSQNILIVDAFNSDAIPVHLLTLDAFKIYKKKITGGGIILVNLSNRHLQLLPLVSAVGRSLDLMVLYINHKGNPSLGQFDSEWALLTENQNLAFNLMSHSNWRFMTNEAHFLWTDDYSNVLPLLKW